MTQTAQLAGIPIVVFMRGEKSLYPCEDSNLGLLFASQASSPLDHRETLAAEGTIDMIIRRYEEDATVL